MKKRWHAAKLSLLVEKQNDISIQKCIDSQPEESLSGAAGVARSTESQDFMATKLKDTVLDLLRLALLGSLVTSSA